MYLITLAKKLLKLPSEKKQKQWLTDALIFVATETTFTTEHVYLATNQKSKSHRAGLI